MKTIWGVVGGLIISCSVYVNIFKLGQSCLAKSDLPWATRSARRLPVPCSVCVELGLSSWWALTWVRVSLLDCRMRWL